MDEIMRRRSIRKFNQDRPVEPEKIERILRAAMQAPSGHNAQEWEFLVIRDAETRRKIAAASVETSAAKNAPVVIVLLVNRDKTGEATGVGAPMIWTADMGAAAQTILIQAEAEGVGGVWLSCWPYEHKVAYLRELFALPAHILPYAVIPVGYKEREKPFDDRWDPEKVHWETY